MSRRHREAVALVAVGVVAVLCATIGAVMLVRQGRATTDTLRDLRGNAVTFDGVIPGARELHRMRAISQLGDGRLIVPAVGLDVPLGAMNVVDNAVAPPTFTSAYWIRNEGVSVHQGATGTVFVAMHSLRGTGVGPGNFLYDTATARARVRRGEPVSIDGVLYRITGTRTVPKPDLDTHAEIWANRPNRLVMITCLERPDNGPSLDNFIVTARRVRSLG